LTHWQPSSGPVLVQTDTWLLCDLCIFHLIFLSFSFLSASFVRVIELYLAGHARTNNSTLSEADHDPDHLPPAVPNPLQDVIVLELVPFSRANKADTIRDSAVWNTLWGLVSCLHFTVYMHLSYACFCRFARSKNSRLMRALVWVKDGSASSILPSCWALILSRW
jgi:hypothetical protein